MLSWNPASDFLDLPGTGFEKRGQLGAKQVLEADNQRSTMEFESSHYLVLVMELFLIEDVHACTFCMELYRPISPFNIMHQVLKSHDSALVAREFLLV
jgi:hypothetical protein